MGLDFQNLPHSAQKPMSDQYFSGSRLFIPGQDMQEKEQSCQKEAGHKVTLSGILDCLIPQ